ncbi:hypothetical protein JDV02_005895 [Purpureocillium takamizusanense]|uniref:Sfi1 spindle body domain-containing protein n=1 Tax=Purpureocillium takamizusanense TaxID=2060973 RepID=A0A9Q8QFA1_9HYPO|nr:uncharacterized protein JDV02_005895 [Purpureocillium takamizusanense]UNI19734.1 hypothetical protein JDV02_005895 [Purpureocillium takamizusanense]
MAHIDSASPPGRARSPTSTGMHTGPDSYYSNQDITILHFIVAAAQDELDHAPEPKPLPAAVLFKAYDEILPTFGIDPDSDHHLSAFIFRIGGEQGNGTLSDKFQLILGRMGIILEFGDNSTISAATSSTLSTSPSQSHSSRPNSALKPDVVGPSHGVPGAPEVSSWNRAGTPFLANLSVRRHVRPNASNLSAQNAPLSRYLSSQSEIAGDRRSPVSIDGHSTRPENPSPVVFQEAFASKIENSYPVSRHGNSYPTLTGYDPTTRALDVPSAGDRWRDLASVLSGHITRGRDALATHRSEALEISTRPDGATTESGLPPSQDLHEPPVPMLANSGHSHASASGERGHQVCIASPKQSSESPATPLRPIFNDKGASKTVRAPTSSHPANLGKIPFHRAARARELYLASKFFNRWAGRTATKLEREAVARRHMIRFRCFQGWSRAPTLKAPAAEHLRATTAVQKLRRAIAYNEEQLSLAAAALAQASQATMVRAALGRWMCQAAQLMFRRRLGSKSLRAGIKRWSSRTQENAVLGRAASSVAARGVELSAVNRWACQIESSGAELAAAQHLATSFSSTSCLNEWAAQVEVSRRAREHRQLRQVELLNTALDSWGLRARAQAFAWRREYLSVAKAFEQWTEVAHREKVAADAAQHHRSLIGVAKVCGGIGRLQNDCLELKRLHARARLFIGSSRLLATLDAAVDRRKNRMRSMVRRYLMARYAQMSSKRRKRNFYTALDRWKAASQGDVIATQVAEDLHAAGAAALSHRAMLVWHMSAIDDQGLQATARDHYKQAWVDAWLTLTTQHGAGEASAWSVWAAEQQRHSLKAWSIATLQRNGQAHTATVLRQRHGRDKWLRALQQWRNVLNDAGPSTKGQLPLRVTEMSSTKGTNFTGWKSLPPRLSYVRRDHDFPNTPMQTPTRWTGSALPVTSTSRTSRFMATVQEADDESAATSSAAGEPSAWGRHSRGSVASLMARQLPSTTPQAPVPTHLERQRQLGRGLLTRSVPVKPIARHARPNRPSTATGPGRADIPGRSPELVGFTAALQGPKPRRVAPVAPGSPGKPLVTRTET